MKNRLMSYYTHYTQIMAGMPDSKKEHDPNDKQTDKDIRKAKR